MSTFGEHLRWVLGSTVAFALLSACAACGGSGGGSHLAPSATTDGGEPADGAAATGCTASSESSSDASSGGSCEAGWMDQNVAPYTALDGGPDQCFGECPSTQARPTPTARPVCPAVEPLASAPCSLDNGTLCSYGDDPRAACRHLYACSSGSWNVMSNWTCPSVASHCPGTAPAQQANCTVQTNPEVPCVFGDLSCYCGKAGIAPGTVAPWLCYGPPADPACPAKAPNIGEGCSTQALECRYAPTGCYTPNSYVFCRNSQWEMEQGPPCAGL